MTTKRVVEYLDKNGSSPFRKWFEQLDPTAAAKITAAMYRPEQGNMSNVKSVRRGVSEYRIDFGPGYRLYLGQEGQAVIILLGGGTKKRQRHDIANAQMLWAEYKSRKRG